MQGHQIVDAAGAGHLDRVLDGPVTALAVLAAGWLLICVRTARRRPDGRQAADAGRSGDSDGPGARGRRGRAQQVVRTAVAFLGAAGLLSQIDGATAAPVRPGATTDAELRVGCDAPLGMRSAVTLSVVTDGGEKVPSLWPVGREHIPERLAPVPGDRVVVVHRGDSLWSLARRHLEPGVSQAAIEQAVLAWYVLNESVIGPDRDLILPGQELHVPGATHRRKSPAALDQVAPGAADHLTD